MTANQDPQPEQGHKTWWWLVAAAGLVALIALGASLLKALPPRGKPLPPSATSTSSSEESSSPPEMYVEVVNYQLLLPDGKDLLQYEVELSTPGPAGYATGGLQYTKKRFLSWSPAAPRRPDFTTSGSVTLNEPEWYAVASAIQTWLRAHAAQAGIAHGEYLPYPAFLDESESVARKPRRWLYLRVQERGIDADGQDVLDYWVVEGGADQFAKARPLVETINRALPASVRKRFALPLPPAGGTAAERKPKKHE